MLQGNIEDSVIFDENIWVFGNLNYEVIFNLHSGDTTHNNCVNSDHFKLGLIVHFASLHCCTTKPSLKGQVTQDVIR